MATFEIDEKRFDIIKEAVSVTLPSLIKKTTSEAFVFMCVCFLVKIKYLSNKDPLQFNNQCSFIAHIPFQANIYTVLYCE